MRIQLQLALDHTPSFKAGSELVLFPRSLDPSGKSYLLGWVFDYERLIPVVFRPTQDGTVGTTFLSCLQNPKRKLFGSRYHAHCALW